MFFPTTLLALAAFSVKLANTQMLNYSTSGNISIIPDSVPLSTRSQWCEGEQNTCPQICGGVTANNSCDPIGLTYNCTCSGGMTTPNISSYNTTLPFYICQQWQIDCIAANAGDSPAQAGCMSVVCGGKNASEAAVSTSSSSSASMTTTSAPSSSGGAGVAATTTSATPSSSPTHGAAVALKVGREFGTGIVGAGVLVAFGLVL